MKKTYSPLISILFLLGILSWLYLTTMPPWTDDGAVALSEFSTKRAMDHVVNIASQPHYVGSENHNSVETYLVTELKKLGLETEIQEGTTLSDWGNLVKSRNILTRIKGSGKQKALLLLSHYDSAPHSYSPGAADDASGLATILESLRAFIHSKSTHQNDIIILFSDAEELGLNGAALFVSKSKWSKDVGLALNFEARGTSGPSYMLMEVNDGNAAMINAFSDAEPQYPVTNSLMYSIYKMLPNDTDLTVFREQGKIPGFNFAFIDSHYNYHTAQDDVSHLAVNTLAHQGTYLMPLLSHFSNFNLNELNSTEEEVYFSTPFNIMHYPFWWNFPLAGIALVMFLFFVFIGMGKRVLDPAKIGMGFVLFLGSLLLAAVLTFFGWKALLEFYPQYNDILQGFTYNGHSYIAMFVFLALSLSFLFYSKGKNEMAFLNYAVAPLFIWLVINIAIAVFLPGASFFIIPVFFGLLMFGWHIISQRASIFMNLLFAIPAVVLFVPFIIMFPIGLGLKTLTGSAILTILVFGLLIPVLGMWQKKAMWSLLFFVIAFGFFVHAHLNSGYEPGKAKPNSLVYYYDADREKAIWATYDTNLDDWTKTYISARSKPDPVLAEVPLFSKYDTQFTHTAPTEIHDLEKPLITFLRDSVGGAQRYMTLKIIPSRKVNRYDIFAAEKMIFHNLKANGATSIGQKGSRYNRKGKKILSYYVVGNEPLILDFSIPVETYFDMSLMESSFDLLNHREIRIKKRADWMMPKPFVLTDAVIIKMKIRSQFVQPKQLTVNDTLIAPRVTDTIPMEPSPVEE